MKLALAVLIALIASLFAGPHAAQADDESVPWYRKQAVEHAQREKARNGETPKPRLPLTPEQRAERAEARKAAQQERRSKRQAERLDAIQGRIDALTARLAKAKEAAAGPDANRVKRCQEDLDAALGKLKEARADKRINKGEQRDIEAYLNRVDKRLTRMGQPESAEDDIPLEKTGPAPSFGKPAKPAKQGAGNGSGSGDGGGSGGGKPKAQ